MKKLILILLVLVVLSVAVVTIATAASTPTVVGVQSGAQSIAADSSDAVVNVSDSDFSSTFASSHHGMCDGGESATQAGY